MSKTLQYQAHPDIVARCCPLSPQRCCHSRRAGPAPAPAQRHLGPCRHATMHPYPHAARPGQRSHPHRPPRLLPTRLPPPAHRPGCSGCRHVADQCAHTAALVPQTAPKTSSFQAPPTIGCNHRRLATAPRCSQPAAVACQHRRPYMAPSHWAPPRQHRRPRSRRCRLRPHRPRRRPGPAAGVCSGVSLEGAPQVGSAARGTPHGGPVAPPPPGVAHGGFR